MADKKKKVLVAIDGSNISTDLISYVGESFSPVNTDIVLYHVDVEVPELFLDTGIEQEFFLKMHSVRAWMIESQKRIEEFMKKAEESLKGYGFTKDSITKKVVERKSGVARDIINESLKGYSAVVLGRTGVSKLKDFIIGSIASKLLGKMHHVPLIVVGKSHNPRKILIGFDGSDCAKVAVNHVGDFFTGGDCHVCLCHVVRPINLTQLVEEPENLPPENLPIDELEWLKVRKDSINPQLDSAAKDLIDAGIPQTRVTKKILVDQHSRAEAIIEEAKKGGFGTIVVGRRGLTFVEEFFLGRVGKKVFQMGDDFTIWVVS
ncbi:MAG: universal stress protein [Desulfobacterales bacterium]|mgnify:CR=1 FL=1|jgi:nucleotide-binding universal stress UspA family protein|nr:universal stress protein [Desulfobacterales bacterium]MBT7697178.1 universal stress protein [Desulfobacterales bacterium]